MKKTTLIAATLVCAASLFVSCGKKAILDDYGFYQDIDDVKAAAKKGNLDVLVFVTQDGDDLNSSKYLSEVIRTDAMKNFIKGKYAVSVFDFSQKTFEKTVVKEDASKEDKSKATAFADLMQKNSRFVSFLNPADTPAAYLLTKEGFYVSQLNVKADDSVADLEVLLNEKASELAELKTKIAATAKGSKEEKLAAIDNIFESTEPNYLFFYIDLINKYIELDKNNDSEKLSKYLITKADYDSANCFYANDSEGSIKVYKTVAENPHLDVAEKQQAYYMIGYLLYRIKGPESIDEIISSFEKAIEVYPDSENVDQLKVTLQYFVDFKANAGSESE